MHSDGWTGLTSGWDFAGKINKLMPVCLLAFNSELCFFFKAAISIFGIIGGPLLGLFTLGIICPFANSKVSPLFGHYSLFFLLI